MHSGDLVTPFKRKPDVPKDVAVVRRNRHTANITDGYKDTSTKEKAKIKI
jgi:hypothetical protein